MEPIAQDEYQMLSRMVGNKIRGYIADNGLKSGDKLPPERVLAEQLEVSRPVIREALGTLEALGLIIKRQGKGTFLTNPNFSVLFHEMMGVWQQDEDNPEQLLQFRVLLEQGSVESIIEQAEASDYERLYSIITQSEQDSLTFSEFIKLDYLFHRELLSLTRNPLFFQLTDVINKYFHWIDTGKLKVGIFFRRQDTIQQHRNIVRLLQEKDKEGAIHLLKMHLNGRKVEE
ncbi:FadR/GntR family transcriptional regulator [Paenibacillus nasutitermitis]|uniref:Transcriptional regulator n=1 Tax=Paenibacillus nasutitermitis TaxID=1652958 RepID=A0A917DNT5_9BACL|nr:FadR/GntR family transcriptional regulator [Paenibacillus nasutitermitis]GGD52001.1 transcriptional regulator [Paenibacillus nasutitermitis]